MSSANLVSWGTPRLAQLLPLDEESLGEIITYSATLSKEECAEHLKNLLGDSPGAFEFIASFNSRREAQQPSEPRSGESTPAAGSRNNYDKGGATKKGGKKGRAPLHSTGPPRRPENYGNVTGGYRKADQEDDYMSMARSRNNNTGGDAASSLSAEPAAFLRPSPRESAASSRNPSPAPKNKVPPSASGPVISELLPNVKSKSAKPSSSRQGGSAAAGSFKNSLTTNDISDLTAAIAALEVSTNPSLSTERRKCTCYASIHPLFDPAPNCLNCGKIICSLEGLQPCSFCGTPLLSNDEVQSIINELRAERGQEKMRVHNEGVQREGGSGPTPGPGGSSSQLDAAKAHRDRLLNFQAQNARRTRVVDEAADFETPNLASTIWMSPAQRALALKKQQRVLREMEEKARPKWEKKKTIMSLDIKGGRVRKVYHEAPAESGPSKEEQEEEAKAEEFLAASDGQQRTGGEAFSRNPLLAAGGLLRPVWKGSSGDKPEARKERKPQTWRRVQDDKDDNEQWILDGGLHGHTTEMSPVHCQYSYG
ncbi:C2HC5-type zinc finger protein [Aspergillus glaucus CBS 516.65]|uniref:TRIP4/RQT4 C2HC5-type zinc finger domain-containing protein n=1 Tax=Aspergillus glaucus CBS 516.65 TaxID=1160497 RepID=A0A1L9V8K4_ASPGL|nr:hypothetical protein ASPGLDRAFT_51761 [Aspergillus glaucus CBS 516.65]OJJ80182.1 hypothetical protein ASPGLDRAFT_51761 [Aspergillus glaucus CBS 516.65]